jgi:acetolactate synthase-1/3 small subunit
MSSETKNRVISLLVDDKPGVMERVSMVFARRGINIDSITVGRANSTKARIVLLYKLDDKKNRHLTALLRKIHQVHALEEFDYENSVLRELALLKVRIPAEETKLKIMREIDQYGARILNVGVSFLLLEISGDSSRVQSFLEKLGPGLIVDVTRSGLAAMQIS